MAVLLCAMYFRLFFLLILSASACSKFRDVPFKPYVPPVFGDSLTFGSLVINEYTVKGNNDSNEFGVPCKWFEIYNPTNKAIALDTNFSFSDTLGNPLKFKLKYATPAHIIQPQGFLVIWCDHMDTAVDAKQVHANFSISSSGEQLGIFYSYPGQLPTVLDSLSFGASSANGVSYGRFPDGVGSSDKTLLQRTPGSPNIF